MGSTAERVEIILEGDLTERVKLLVENKNLIFGECENKLHGGGIADRVEGF